MQSNEAHEPSWGTCILPPGPVPVQENNTRKQLPSYVVRQGRAPPIAQANKNCPTCPPGRPSLVATALVMYNKACSYMVTKLRYMHTREPHPCRSPLAQQHRQTGASPRAYNSRWERDPGTCRNPPNLPSWSLQTTACLP